MLTLDEIRSMFPSPIKTSVESTPAEDPVSTTDYVPTSVANQRGDTGPVNAEECLCRLGRVVQNCPGDKCRGERCKGTGRSHRSSLISLCVLCQPETSAS